MTAESLSARILRDSVIIAFVVGVLASIFANSLSAAFAARDYSLIFSLGLAALLLIVSWATVLVVIELLHLRKNISLAGIPGCSFRTDDKIGVADFLSDARSEICFLGITAKRTFSDDRFKEFLTNHAGTAMRIRVLLLDPNSVAFAQRALEEKESADSWKQELAATVHKLNHYRTLFGINIEIRYYRLYPVLRLVIVDNRRVIANFFLEGRRGTESAQLVFEDSQSDLARCFLKWFNAVWHHHSEAVDP